MPALLGLPILARFIGWLFASLISYFAKYFTIGIARIAIAISLFIGLVIGLNELFLSYLTDLVSVLPQQVSDSIAYIMPINAMPCLYAIFSMKAAVFIFDVKDRIIGYLDWNKT